MPTGLQHTDPKWLLYALGSALFASLTPVLAKVGLKSVDSATASVLRSLSLAAFLVCAVSVMRAWPTRASLASAGWRSLLLIALSGVAGGASWLFYFKALSIADASKVLPIDKLSLPLSIVLLVGLLSEKPTGVNWLGVAIMTVGSYLAVMPPKPTP